MTFRGSAGLREAPRGASPEQAEAESSSGAYAIQAFDLEKRYGALIAVQHLNLAVRRGEIYGFLGPNGAGKTTTLRILLGIDTPTNGRVEVLGQAPTADPYGVKPRVGVVCEYQFLYDDLTAWEYLRFFADLYRVERPAVRAGELLARLGLDEFRRLRARDFSHGMQQKLGLARALLHRPELLILDEPVSGLDPHGIRQVREILLEENRRGRTVLISSHVLSEVERTAHRVGILQNGQLVAEGDVASIGAKLQPTAAIEVDVEQLAPEALMALRGLSFVHEAVVVGEHNGQAVLRVAVAPGSDRRRELSATISRYGGLVTQLRQERLSLEEAFVLLTAENVAPLAAGEGA